MYNVQVASQNSSEREVLHRPLRKSKAFHDKEILDQQVKEDELYKMEMKRKIVEQYVQHVYEIKLEHQVEFGKGREKGLASPIKSTFFS